MSIISITRFKINPADAATLQDRHAALVTATRAAVAGLAETQLGKVDDESWVALWHWNSAESIRAARAHVAGQSEAAATFALAREISVEEIHVVG